MKPRTLILRTAGTNCDRETAYAFELAGSQAEFVHLNRVMESPERLADFQILAIPGGFSYGDDISAGRIFANQINHHLGDGLRRFVEDSKPIIGICNGFQVLIRTQLLGTSPADGSTCTLTANQCMRFVDRWVHLRAMSRKCIWTKGLEQFELPVAHGEGRFVTASDEARQALWDQDGVALVYTKPDGSPAAGRIPDNPNGSVDDIAGICDASGLVLGLMPHPERHVSIYQHYSWGNPAGVTEGDRPGLRLFSNAVSHVSQAVGRGV